MKDGYNPYKFGFLQLDDTALQQQIGDVFVPADMVGWCVLHSSVENVHFILCVLVSCCFCFFCMSRYVRLSQYFSVADDVTVCAFSVVVVYLTLVAFTFAWTSACWQSPGSRSAAHGEFHSWTQRLYYPPRFSFHSRLVGFSFVC